MVINVPGGIAESVAGLAIISRSRLGGIPIPPHARSVYFPQRRPSPLRPPQVPKLIPGGSLPHTSLIQLELAPRVPAVLKRVPLIHLRSWQGSSAC